MTHLLLVAATAVALAAVTPAAAKDRAINAEMGPIRVETVATGLAHPWGIAFLPDGRMLVTERPGRLRIVSLEGEVSDPLSGVPEVYAQGQGGLLDVALDPDFASNRLIYLSYAEPGAGGASTAVARGRLTDAGIRDPDVIFSQQPKVSGGAHFGSRLAFSPDGMLFVTLGERFKSEPAQDLGNHLGKIVRIAPNGSVPPDNPFVGQSNALPEIWSYGHRNVQGAAIHPQTGRLWSLEFGPRGGDELNIPEAGRNYGWPLVSWGRHYTMINIPDPPTRPDLADAIYHWTPAISPSGMAFYTGTLFAPWQGDLLIAGLGSQTLVRLELNGEKVTGEDRIGMSVRIRQVAEGPDGAVYLLTDQPDGSILRLTPAPQ